MASRACAIGCLAAGVVVARPAAAAMTIALRDQDGHTRTCYQDGSRVRVANPSGDDDGEAQIVDLKTNEHVIVYDDAKAYTDFKKAVAAFQAAAGQDEKTRPHEKKKRAPVISYRALGAARHVGGLACAMYERLSNGTPDAKICFAPWGGAVGPREDFLWFDELIERIASGGGRPKQHIHTLAQEEGLVLWIAQVNDEGRTDTMEIVKLSRDPVPATLLHVPSDYKEFSRPLTASEHPKLGPPPMDDGRAHSTERLPKGFGGIVALVLAFGLIVGTLIHAAILHLAASIVIDQARFMQAVVATVIISIVVTVVEVIGPPEAFAMAFTFFTVFAGLKISYGVSVARTLALCVVSLLIVLAMVFALAALGRGCAPS